MLQSIDDKIIYSLKKSGRGVLFSPADFRALGNASSVSKAIERMARAGTVIRVARGIYCYPKVDKELGIGVLYPGPEEIAQYVAKRDKARIAPTGMYAENRLGLSQQVPMRVVYLTDGSARNIPIQNKTTITFKHTAPKNLAFTNTLAMLLTFALKSIGEGNLSDEQIETLKALLAQEDKEAIKRDFKIMPAWIQKTILRLYDE